MANPALVVRVAANIEELRKNLKEGRDQIEITTAGMTKLASSLSGERLIQQANNITAAVAQIGGATKLTESEKARLNSTLQKAIEKYQVMGREAPSAMLALERSTRTASEAVGDDSGGLVGKFTMLRNALVALGVAKYASEAIRFGSQLTDLAAATGLTVQELQRLNFAGVQVGVSMETSARAIQRLQRSLVDGDNSAVKAVENLGLNVRQLMAMSPADMFDAISAAIAKLPSPALRSAAAIEILGRQGGELLPLLLADVNKLSDGFVGMSDSAVAGADRFDDAWETAKIRVKSAVGELIGAFGSLESAWEFLTRDPAEFEFKRLTAEIDRQIESMNKVAGVTSTYGKNLVTAVMSTRDTARVMADATVEADKLAAELKKAADEAERFRQRIRGLADQMGGQALQQQIRETGLALADLAARGLKPSEAELAKLIPRLREWEAAGQPLPANLRKIIDESNRLSDQTLAWRGRLYEQIATMEEFNATTEATGSAVEAMVVQWNRAFANAQPLDSLFNFVTFGSAPGAGSGTSGSMTQDLFDNATRLQSALKTSRNEFTELMQTVGVAGNILERFGEGIGSDLVSQIGRGTAALTQIGQAASAAAALATSTWASFLPVVGAMVAADEAIYGQQRRTTALLKQEFMELNATLKASGVDALAVGEIFQRFGGEIGKFFMGGANEKFADMNAELRALVETLDDAAEAQLSLAEAMRAESDAVDRVRKLTEQYGISFDALGSKIVGADLAQKFLDMADAFGFMKDRGGEVTVILEGMKDEAQQFLDRAFAFGLEVPASMRPLLQALIEAGMLVDADGKKLEDLSTINFEETLGNSIKSVADAIADLPKGIADAFRLMFGDIDNSASFLADNLRAKFGAMKFSAAFTTEAPEEGEGGGGGFEPRYSFAGGSGGFMDFGSRGTTVRLHGREEVRTEVQARSDGGSNAALLAEVAGLRRDFKSLPTLLKHALPQSGRRA